MKITQEPWHGVQYVHPAEEPIDLELGADGVWAVPEPGCEDTQRIYRDGVFVGRICKQVVYDCTGRVREGDEFEAFAREQVKP